MLVRGDSNRCQTSTPKCQPVSKQQRYSGVPGALACWESANSPSLTSRWPSC